MYVYIHTGTQLFHDSKWDTAITVVLPCTDSSNTLISSAANLLIGCCHAKQVRHTLYVWKSCLEEQA